MTNPANVDQLEIKLLSPLTDVSSTIETTTQISTTSAISNVDITTHLPGFNHLYTAPLSPIQASKSTDGSWNHTVANSAQPQKEKEISDRSTPIRKSMSCPVKLENEFSEEPPELVGGMFVEGITGPNSQYVVLVTSDFHEFIIRREIAYMSPTVKRILDSRVRETKPWCVCEVLVNYPSLVMRKVVDYLVLKEYYERTHQDPPEFTVDPTIVLEVLMASQFLDI